MAFATSKSDPPKHFCHCMAGWAEICSVQESKAARLVVRMVFPMVVEGFLVWFVRRKYRIKVARRKPMGM